MDPTRPAGADTAAIAAFLAGRETATDTRWAADREALWAATRRERWDVLTVAEASRRLRAWHDGGRPVPTERG